MKYYICIELSFGSSDFEVKRNWKQQQSFMSTKKYLGYPIFWQTWLCFNEYNSVSEPIVCSSQLCFFVTVSWNLNLLTQKQFSGVFFLLYWFLPIGQVLPMMEYNYVNLILNLVMFISAWSNDAIPEDAVKHINSIYIYSVNRNTQGINND